MRTNEGIIDRTARIIVGLALLSLLFVGPVPGWGLVGVIGFIPLITGFIGYCPTYTLLGIDTRSPAEKGGKQWIGR